MSTDNKEEIELLREVFEAVRQYLRFRGIDKERTNAAIIRMDNACEYVKDFDAYGSQKEL